MEDPKAVIAHLEAEVIINQEKATAYGTIVNMVDPSLNPDMRFKIRLKKIFCEQLIEQLRIRINNLYYHPRQL